MRSPTTTPVPDEIFDYWLTRLGEAELKVLLYIVRRTLGFFKRTDAISLSQLCDGIPDRDEGTGLARSSVKEALKGLKDKGLIQAIPQNSEESGHLPTLYSVLWDPLPLAGKTTKPLAVPAKPPLAGQPAIQETVLQETAPPLPPASGGSEPEPNHIQGEPGGGFSISDELATGMVAAGAGIQDLIGWIEAECSRLAIRPGFHTTSPAAKRALRDGDTPALRSAILHILEGAAGMQRNVTSLITGLVSFNGQAHRGPPAPMRRKVHEPFPTGRTFQDTYTDRPKPPSKMELAVAHLRQMKQPPPKPRRTA